MTREVGHGGAEIGARLADGARLDPGAAPVDLEPGGVRLVRPVRPGSRYRHRRHGHLVLVHSVASSRVVLAPDGRRAPWSLPLRNLLRDWERVG
ncbi:MAG: hypothetical protein ACLP50_20880 [Solirubrobacteraceae bacterium]